jgi:RHS repeat-associated protein
MKSGKLLAIVAVVFLCGSAFAQSNPNEEQGLKPYDTLHGDDLDSVSVTNGGLTLHIPLVSFPQRGDLDLSFFVSFSNKHWYIKPQRLDSQGHVVTPAQWLPMPNTGVQIVSSVDWWVNSCLTAEADTVDSGQVLYDWSDNVTSPDGSTHTFGDQTASYSGPVYPLRSLDASGLLRPDVHTVVMPNGTRYTYPSFPLCDTTTRLGVVRGGHQASAVADANGNQITIGTSGWTDTMGRFLPGSVSSAVHGIQPGVSTTDLSKCPSGTSSALVWNVPGVATVNGGVRTFYFCYSMFSISTNFDSTTSQGANNYGPVSTSLLSAIVMPDPSQIWTFTYDNYGDVLQVSFPTGGSLGYTYGIGPPSAAVGTGFSVWVMSRTVNANDGSGGHQWIYNYQGNFPAGGSSIYLYPAKGVAIVTDPQGNDVVHTIGPGTGSSGCPGYVYQSQYFQGSAGSGTILKTVQTQYTCTMGTPGGDLDGTALNAVPTQVTTIWPGGQSVQVVHTFDPTFNDPNGQAVRIGSLLENDQYDFSNTLVRSTVNHYAWQDDSTYATNNFVSLPAWITVYNGAPPSTTGVPTCSSSGSPACVSQTTYGYDQASLVPSGIGTPTHVGPPAGEPIRGNRTSTSHWLNTTNSFLSSTATYFDTGMPASSTPPANADGLNRTTTYSYSSTFLGAYLTQTNMPDTQMPDTGAPVVHHIISGNYDFNTGLLTSFTDENSQPYTYQYDIMLRLTQGNHPDGGVTKFIYPDPNTVERQRLITGTTYDDFKVKFDGVGRPYQTQQLTPDCTSYIKVDTTYDSVGRAATVSNPYCLTSETTYGITQTQYDALSRATKTIKQDGSFSQAKYDQSAGDGASSLVECTTAVDEAGRQRQSCADALGRMVKVLEGNPGAAATNATGWVSISGTEQTANSQPATSGTGTVTISAPYGGDLSVEVDPCADAGGSCPYTIWDAGSVYITVNGHQDSTSYGRIDSPASIAANLASAINNDSGAFVWANASGAAVNLSARSTGASTNYSFTTTSATSDPSDFGGGSFLTSPASGALTGGQNASSTPDTGTITFTVNGTGYATSYGASDTSSTIAGRLAGIISSGSYANATASGSTINLTSKTAGTAGDFSLSASYTWNSAQFTNASFTTSTSGPALTGALDASAVNNHPYVTTYQYNVRGDMLCVHQKGTDTTADVACTGTSAPSAPAAWRQRFFTYDSFSRLLTAMNPETNSTGTTAITYTYDADGNVTSKKEPAPNQAWGSAATVTINYTNYDALNRLLNTTYSDGVTPATAHRYDYASYLGQTFAYPIGREVAATAANNTIAYFTSYDKMGRVAQTVQCTPGVSTCQTFTGTYDKLGDVLTLGYPGNGFTVTYGYDSAARLTSATDSNGVIYAQTPTFLASGAIKEFTSPNFANNKYHVDYNNRLQPTEIWTGSAQGASALFDKQYTYNAPNTSQMNNGNIYTVTNVKDGTRTQTFAYDVLNRLTSAGDQTHWGNTYAYDPWGNLLQKNPGSPAGENLVKTADANNHLSGLTYDAAGNEINDGLGGSFVYDAENRITTAGGVTYTYDADSRRVKKSSGTNYWYGPIGAALAETDSGGNWTNYIFFAGQRLARNVSGDIKYYITDHLHSTAMFVDKAGTTAAILDDNDFYPWGGVVPGVGKTNSNNTVKFTGQYRDTESNLDYFGARYYANVTGRFMSADWAGAPTSVPYAEFGDPQSLNLYSYVRNSPVVRVDADGHEAVIVENDGLKNLKIPSPSDCPGLSECRPGDASDVAPSRLSWAIGALDAVPKELGNTIFSLYNLTNSIACWIDPHCDSPKQTELDKPSSPEEAKVMQAVAIAMLFFPSEGEAKGATVLYARFSKGGEFLKWGISRDLLRRYTQKELAGDVLIAVTRGSRKSMERLERWLTERAPGALNHEPWAGSKFSEIGLRAVERVLNRIWPREPM